LYSEYDNSGRKKHNSHIIRFWKITGKNEKEGEKLSLNGKTETNNRNSAIK
jgi:hypothetical protein